VFHVVLHEPEIPGNTGNVIRLCANAGCRLHLIEPLGFQLDRRSLRRAALDYEELTVLQTHVSLAACRRDIEAAAARAAGAANVPRWFAIETGGGRLYSEAAFRPGDVLLFGSETRGLPADVTQSLPEAQQLQVPMQPGNRSLNLSNCVALVVYEAWRQNGFRIGATGQARSPNQTPA
jgi:tRNA (cytidine/uridine-2'-O-)-methyltransferase